MYAVTLEALVIAIPEVASWLPGIGSWNWFLKTGQDAWRGSAEGEVRSWSSWAMTVSAGGAVAGGLGGVACSMATALNRVFAGSTTIVMLPRQAAPPHGGIARSEH